MNALSTPQALLTEATLSFSCEGEDVLIRRVFDRHFFEHVPKGYRGVYVDVGAYDPWRHSNTAALWLEGWKGVNIDPNPATWQRFNEVRPGDDNHCVGVGAHEGSADYVEFDRPELNGFLTSKQIKEQEARGATVLHEHRRGLTTLGKIMELHPRCDFLNIDVEGHELGVLHGFYNMHVDHRRPMVICVEILEKGYGGFLKHPVVQYLKGLDYVLLSRLHCSSIFVDKRRAVFR